ncbi:MAG TPA: S9 family peptidase [Chthoniobacterales bacterium]
MVHRLLTVLAVAVFLPLSGMAEEPTIAPNDNLVLDGVPPIPVSIAEKARRYTDFRLGIFAAWHPSERKLLILTRFAETAQVHEVAGPGADRRQLTFFPDAVTGAEYPKDDDSYVLINKSAGGNEFSQNYRLDLDTGDITLLTDGSSKNSAGIFSNDGRLVYTSTRRTRKDTDFYIVDPKDPKSDRLLTESSGGGWSPLDWSPDGKQILVVEYVSITDSNLWLIDAATGQKTLLTPKPQDGTQVSYSGGLFGTDGLGIYTATDKGAEFRRLTYIDLRTRQPDVLSGDIPWDVEQFDLSADGKYLAFVTNEAGSSILHVLDTATRKPVPSPKLPPGVIGALDWHPKLNELAFSLASARSPADTYTWKPGAPEITRWTFSETGGLNPANFSEANPIRWKSFDGREITGFLYKPAPTFSGKRPVIINIHGGPESQYRPGYLGRNNYYLNELGVVLIFPNVRGSSGYGKSFVKLDNGYQREDSVKDIGALIDWIATQPNLDANRIMITGGSYGGYMTLASSVHFGDRIRCSLDVVGISNFVTFLEKTENYRRDLRRVEYGDERNPKMREFLEKISPLNAVDKITKPIFIVQGANDPRVPRNEAEQILKALRQKNREAWFLMAKDEGHGFQKKPNADFQFYATVVFIQKYLLGEG